MAIKKTIEIDVNTVQAIGGLENLSKALDKVDASAKGVDATFEEVYGDLQPLTARMGEAEDRLYELAKAGQQGSQEYKELLSSVAEYKKVQQQTDLVVDAASQTLGNKLSGSLNAVAGGFSLVQGTMALYGAESKDVEQAILKVQAAMAISQGVETIREGAKSVNALGTAIKATAVFQKISTAAQWLWNTAMAANPVGAIVAVVVALIAAGYKLVNMFMDSAEANEQAMAATKKNTNALKEQEKASKNSVDKLTEYNTQQYNLAKANGASSESLRKLALKHAEEAVSLNYKNTMLARSTFLREADTLATLKANDASDEAIAAQDKLVKASYEAFNKQREGLYDSYKQRKKVINDNEVAVAQEATDRRKKASDEAQKHHDDLLEKQKEANKKAAEERKKAAEEEKEFLNTLTTARINNAAEEARNKIDIATQQMEALNAIVEVGDAVEEEFLTKKKERTDKELEIERLKQEGQVALAQKTSEMLGAFSDLLGKETAEGKALAIAQATINAYLGISEVWKAKNVYPEPYGTATKIASTVVIAAAAFKTVKDIAAVQVPGGGGGGGGSAPTGGAAPAAPSFNVVGNGGTNQLAQVMSDKGAAPVQAFVVASNVTSAQSLNRNIVNNATLG